MEKVGCRRTEVVPKKDKKKQAKDGLDRLKQAEKKKRRLEKALATSAAIISELEKKKQKKKEEQQRLDEEGAAIAEAVALHVLGEDADEPCPVVLNDSSKCNLWGNIDRSMASRSFATNSASGPGWTGDAYVTGGKQNNCLLGHSLASLWHARDLRTPYYDEAGQQAEISPELIAAQAVSSLQIAEDSQEGRFTGQRTGTVAVNRMTGGRTSVM